MAPTAMTDPAGTAVVADVLLIDSEAATATSAPMLSSSHRVFVSSRLASARAVLGRTNVDLIVTDLELPDGTGVDVCRDAKGRSPPTAVLVTTEKVDLVPGALEAGCDGVLLKPFAPNLVGWES